MKKQDSPKAIEHSLRGVRLVDMPIPPKAPNLEELRKALRACLAIDNGPLIHASKVCELEGMWDRYKREAGGVSFDRWIKITCGPEFPAKLWRRCHSAVVALGEHVRRTLHYQVALFIAEKLDEATREGAVRIIQKARRAQNMHLLGLKQSKKLLRESGHYRPKARGVAICLRCAKLEKILEKHGIDWRKEFKDAAE